MLAKRLLPAFTSSMKREKKLGIGYLGKFDIGNRKKERENRKKKRENRKQENDMKWLKVSQANHES